MPPARSATAEPRRHERTSTRRKPHHVPLRAPKLRVRWERLGRIGLLVVLTIVVGLYVEHTLSYFSTRSQADALQATVSTLRRQNAQLERRQAALHDPATIVQDARGLGMVRPGEQPFLVLGMRGGATP